MGCFASLTREKLFENLRAKRLDPFFKINIDEGQGAEIEQKLAVLMQIATLSIAPMFSWFFPTPLRTNPFHANDFFFNFHGKSTLHAHNRARNYKHEELLVL